MVEGPGPAAAGTGARLLRRHRAEYLAVIPTASFLPPEIYELVERVEASRALVVHFVARLAAERRYRAG